MIRPSWIFLAVMTMSAAALSSPIPTATSLVEAITNERHPMTGVQALQASGIEVRIYDLDAPKRALDELMPALPADREAALAAARRWLDGLDQERLRVRLAQAYAAQAKMLEYGLDRYPAIVFDGRFVVYGVTDLLEAWRIYRHGRTR